MLQQKIILIFVQLNLCLHLLHFGCVSNMFDNLDCQLLFHKRLLVQFLLGMY